MGHTVAHNILITGCSTGFGLGAAERLAREGHLVHATLRNLDRAGPLEKLRAEGLPIEVLKLDVNSTDEVEAAIATASAERPIDVLINNAGYEVVAPVEHLSDAHMLAQFETNVFGVVRTIRAVLPSMRPRKRGRIINISSAVAHMGTQHRAAYSASKHALEGLSRALWIELRPFGVAVISISPGAFPTQFAANYVYVEGFDEKSPYWPYELRLRDGVGPMIAEMKARQSPEAVVDAIVRAVSEPDPPYEWIVGLDAEKLIPLYRQKSIEDATGGWYRELGMEDLLVLGGNDG